MRVIDSPQFVYWGWNRVVMSQGCLCVVRITVECPWEGSYALKNGLYRTDPISDVLVCTITRNFHHIGKSYLISREEVLPSTNSEEFFR